MFDKINRLLVQLSKLKFFVALLFPTFLVSAELIVHYKADGNALDSVGLNDGIMINGVGFETGQIDQAFDFNGANNFVQVADNPVLDVDFPLTIAAWVRPESNGAVDATTGILWRGDSVSSPTGQSFAFLWYIDKVSFRLSDGSNLYGVCCAPIPLNYFSHIAGTFDGLEIKLYLNGILVSTSSTVPASIYDSSSSLLIGSTAGSPPTRFYFDGQIDDVRIYDHVLSEVEVLLLADVIFEHGFE
ncbi:hypothetical protein MNBD_GAMMA02-181 [hydrothermal vent metagenome]|uniref:LamG-like jellyroll fold domain-containing protein n=1 Tax=hydrothermal vent metagenome TaxID=652676 RepID=A0A3B0W4A9_9ZZZZ